MERQTNHFLCCLNRSHLKSHIFFLFQLRLFRNNLSEEEIIKDRTHQIFYEKCRDHFPEMEFPKK